MIPLRLNLLSPQKRHHLHTMVCFQFTKNLLEIILVILCISGIVMLGAQRILQDYFIDLSNTISFMQSQRLQTNRNVRQINEALVEITKIQKDYQAITPILSEVLSLLPVDINLNILTVDTGTEQIIFTGMAGTRGSLLSFKQALESNTNIANTDLPLAQLTIKQNLPFSLTAKLK